MGRHSVYDDSSGEVEIEKLKEKGSECVFALHEEEEPTFSIS
jgi:hypothetical protein